MNDYLERWFEGLPALHRWTVQSVISVTGHCDRHYGPMSAYARLQLRIEPATQFEVLGTAPEIKFRIKERVKYSPDHFVIPKDELTKTLDWAIFGLLDALIPNEHAPELEFRIVLEEMEYCAIDSSQMAFRIAGRDAGQKIIEARKASRRQVV